MIRRRGAAPLRTVFAGVAFTLAMFAALLVARPANAHPAGFTSVNRYIGVICEEGPTIRIAYVLDFAEMPSVAELDLLDPDHDGAATPREQEEYLERRLPPLVAAWLVEVDDEVAKTKVVTSRVDVSPGEQGLQIVRITAEVEVDRRPASPSADGTIRVRVRDLVYADRSGWREMAAGDTKDAVVVDGPRGQTADALSYGSGRAAPRVNDARFTFRLVRGAAPSPASTPLERSALVDERLARLSRTMRQASGSWTFSALALLMALGLGAAHALSPGHGKTLAAAYLVGRRARPRQALVFGATVTVAHTAVVFLIGGLAVTIERSVGSDRLMRGVEIVSALTVLALGAVQLSRRWRELATGHADHDHAEALPTSGTGAESVVALGAASGLVPCPSALAILLTAIALHRYAFGLVLVLSFSLGVAVTLTTVGLVVVVARGWVDRAPRARPLVRWLPVVSSVCVLAIGLLLCAGALAS